MRRWESRVEVRGLREERRERWGEVRRDEWACMPDDQTSGRQGPRSNPTSISRRRARTDAGVARKRAAHSK